MCENLEFNENPNMLWNNKLKYNYYNYFSVFIRKMKKTRILMVFVKALMKQSSLGMMILSPNKYSPKCSLQYIIKYEQTFNKQKLRYYMNRVQPPTTPDTHTYVFTFLKGILTELMFLFYQKLVKKRLSARKIIRNNKSFTFPIVHSFRHSFNYKCKKIQAL